jgi:hypothetical protein
VAVTAAALPLPDLSGESRSPDEASNPLLLKALLS